MFSELTSAMWNRYFWCLIWFSKLKKPFTWGTVIKVQRMKLISRGAIAATWRLCGEQNDRCSVKRVCWTQTYKSGQLSRSLWHHPPAVCISVSMVRWGRCSSTCCNVKRKTFVTYGEWLNCAKRFRQIHHLRWPFCEIRQMDNMWTQRIWNPYTAPWWPTLD